MLHETGGEQQLLGRAERRGVRQAARGAGRQDEVREPGMIFRCEAQARLGRTAEGAAHQHAIYAVALAIVGQAVAREGEEHREDDEALLPIEERGDAALFWADRYDAEIEAFFGNVFLINRITGSGFEIDQDLRDLRRAPVETGTSRAASKTRCAGKEATNADDIRPLQMETPEHAPRAAQPGSDVYVAEDFGMIDKKITWALIFAIVIESAGVFAWAGGIGERLKEVEARAVAQSEMAVRLARVEVKLELVVAQLTRIEARLDR